jgi:hypothetical protein
VVLMRVETSVVVAGRVGGVGCDHESTTNATAGRSRASFIPTSRHSRLVWAGMLRDLFGFPPHRRSKRRTKSAHPASPRRPGAICRRTRAVPRPYRQRPKPLSLRLIHQTGETCCAAVTLLRQRQERYVTVTKRVQLARRGAAIQCKCGRIRRRPRTDRHRRHAERQRSVGGESPLRTQRTSLQHASCIR